MPPTAYRLTQSLAAERPSRWDIQARYAMRIPAERVQLPAGTWLLALPPADSDYPHPPHYRLADGRVVAIPEPLTPELAVPLTDPQALTALARLTVDDFGICSGLPSPYLQEPALLEPDPAEVTPLSCAEVTWREEQSLLINTQVAAVAAQYAYDLVVRRTLNQFATYLNLEPPTARALLLTSTNLARFGLPV